jgi:hypothetical protein
VVPALTIALVLCGILIPSLSRSGAAQGRTVNGAYMVFLLGWLLTAFVYSRAWAPSLESTRALLRPIGSAALLVFGLAMVLDGNTRIALTDLRSDAPRWHAAQAERYEILERSAGGQATVQLDPLGATPRLFFAADIVESASGARNSCVAHYFGVSAVVLKGTATPDSRGN